MPTLTNTRLAVVSIRTNHLHETVRFYRDVVGCIEFYDPAGNLIEFAQFAD